MVSLGRQRNKNRIGGVNLSDTVSRFVGAKYCIGGLLTRIIAWETRFEA